jgi:trk system potassium uptake protein TrkA
LKIIICGGGHVGLSIAQYLEGEYEITLIDTSAAVLSEASEKVDLQTILGNAADPETLERAGAANASILIAVTGVDEINIVTCQMAHAIFNVNLKIARLRNICYSASKWSAAYRDAHLPIDVMISPEEEVAAAISRHLQVPFAFEVLSLGSGKLQVLGVKIPPKSPIFFTPLHHFETLFPDLQLSVLRVLRDKEVITLAAQDELLPGDEAYFLFPQNQLNRFIETVGFKDEQNHRLLIVGGGRVGLRLAAEIEKTYPLISCTLIEYEKNQTRHLVSQLNNTLVLQGDALDNQLLQEAGIESVDTFVAVTNDDKVNILGSLLAKRKGARRAVTLVNRRDYMSLMVSLGIDKILSPSNLTISLILQRVRKGYIQVVHSLGERVGEIMEIDLYPTAYAVGQTLAEVNHRKDLWVSAIIRHDEIILSRPDLVLQAHDTVILTLTRNGYKRLKRFFEPRFDLSTHDSD